MIVLAEFNRMERKVALSFTHHHDLVRLSTGPSAGTSIVEELEGKGRN
jgi:hypothetical protein